MKISDLKIGCYLVEVFPQAIRVSSGIYKVIDITNEGITFCREGDTANFTHDYQELDGIIKHTKATYYIANSDIELLPLKLKFTV